MATVPGTHSPGRVILEYMSSTGVRHSTSLRVVNGAMPATIGAADLIATEFAEALAAFLNADAADVIDRWKLLDAEDKTVAAGGFGGVLQGTNVNNAGLTDSRSATIAFLGYSAGTALDEQIATTKITLFVGSTYPIPVGVQTLPLTAYAGFGAFAAFLTGSGELFADVYGRKAQLREYIAVQYNAGTQRRHGA